MASDFESCRKFFALYFLTTVFISSISSSVSDRITRGQTIRDGDTIVSAGETFALGFFGSQVSNFRYVGIWYHSIPNGPIVWVANRDRPISGTNGVLSIQNDGNLAILNGNGDIIWRTNATVQSNNSTAVLNDSGDLVLVQDGNTNRILWRSFDSPFDTYLPGMMARVNVREGEKAFFTSWRTETDPSPGNYTMGIDPRGSPQIVIWEGPNRRWRSGHWNGVLFTGVPGVRGVFLFGFSLINDGNGNLTLMYTPADTSELIYFRVTWNGTERQERWNNVSQKWDLVQSHPTQECDRYNYCGSFGLCNQLDERICSCMNGFVPRYPDEWNRQNWTGGCVRRTRLQCEETDAQARERKGTDGFRQADHVKLPDFVDYVGSEDSEGCRRRCLENCSCSAYAYVSGINCMTWNRDLIDVEEFKEDGSAIFIRVAGSELGDGSNSRIIMIVIPIVVVALILFLCVSIWLVRRRKERRQETLIENEIPKLGPSGEFSSDISGPSDLGADGKQSTGAELVMFSFNHLAAATDYFSHQNKLGEGGFGHVYKGILPGGQEIAVKRLSRKSGQGCEEFKNEVVLIAKLQHRNLVRILGCCIEGEEKMLLYEYMPNKSLDSYLFDSDKQTRLDWSTRFNIIEGIARGLLYLHRDSRLRIIHRDLKASNILLDLDMNPKISDFGMARIFGGNQNEANTNRVVGTYGYMAPEYAMEGLFSLKSDVYSLGVLLLEIVTGRRNTSFRSTGHSNIIGHAWDMWDKGKAIELLDPSIADSSNREQVLRCIHVGMLCVQDMAAHRPDMPSVLLMLESENATCPMPKQPTITSMRHYVDPADLLNEINDVESSNNVTMTVILGR